MNRNVLLVSIGVAAIAASVMAVSPALSRERAARPTIVVVWKVIPPGESKVVEARCPHGKAPLAGGFRADAPIVVHQSSLGNLGTPPSWHAWRVIASNPRPAPPPPGKSTPPPVHNMVAAQAICP
jgi:hypothetical protein